MNVLQVITKGEVGGAQSHVRTLCAELQGRGVHVEVAIGGTRPEPLAIDLQALGLPVHRIAALGNRLHPLPLWRATRELLRLVRERRPDLLHAHSAMAGVAARIAGALAGVPVVYTVHGFAFKPGHPPLRRAIAWATECLLAPLTRRLVCVSAHEQALARALPLPRRRVRVIANGVEDLPRAASALSGSTGHTGPISAVMVARMAPPKRPDLLLQALARVRDLRGEELPAHFLGSGPDLAAHRALAERLDLRTVRFEGDVPDVPAHLARHAVFVLLSDHEGLPISLIEAMRAGMAIVASDLPGVRELLPDAECALHVPPEAGALAQALQQLIESPATRARLGAAARRRYERHYTAERMGDAVQALYADALRGVPSPTP